MKLGCCGDDCNYCPRYTGTISNNENELKKAAEIWYAAGLRDRILSPAEMKCLGCSTNNRCTHGIKECCAEKNIANCGYCHEYPCIKLKIIFKKTKEFAEKSKLLFKNDLQKTLKKAFYMKEKYLNNIKKKFN